jgi:phospholipase C
VPQLGGALYDRVGAVKMRLSKWDAWAKRGATGAALALCLGLIVSVPSSGVRAAGSPIQHVAVLDLENHSWANVLGFWCRNNPRCGAGDAMPASVTLSDGSVVTPTTDPDVVPAVDHSMKSQLAAMNGGKMNGWQNDKGGQCNASTGYRCISGYQSSQVPNLTTLANVGALNDRFFSMKDSPSWGGHMYAVAGTTDGFTGDNPLPASGVTGHSGWGCDSDKVAFWGSGNLPQGPSQPSCVPDFALGLPNGGAFEPTKALYVPTIMDRLDTAGLSWKIYGAANPAEQTYIWNTCATFSECLNTSQHANVVDPSQFFTDASGGTLPSLSLIMAGGAAPYDADTCHNGSSMTACDNYVGQVAQALMSSPEWASSALFITFDDYGGFYDSAVPGVNPDGTQQGIRLPFILVSPYAKQASTDSTPASFASVLAFIEHNFNVPPLEQNDASAYDLSGMFSLSAKSKLGERARMVTRPVPKGDHIVWSELKQDT